jgi:TrmH family RNA methyltransferase
VPGSEAVIRSVRNQRVVDARKLKQRKHRRRQGRFIVEDLPTLCIALDAGADPVEVFYCESFFVGLEAFDLLDRLRRDGAEMVSVAPHVMETLTERSTPQGIVVTFDLFEASFESLCLDGHDLVLVLDRLQDPGNIGTLIRTADAVGAAAVILIEPCVDPFDPKTVRGTMGSIFNVPIVRTGEVAELFKGLQSKGLRVVGTDARRGDVWGEGLWAGGVSLVLGNEAHGLSHDVSTWVKTWARLPIVGKAESLNVAVAGSVLMYTWLRANLGEEGSS